jgi:hypothetical protein
MNRLFYVIRSIVGRLIVGRSIVGRRIEVVPNVIPGYKTTGHVVLYPDIKLPCLYFMSKLGMKFYIRIQNYLSGYKTFYTRVSNVCLLLDTTSTYIHMYDVAQQR